MTAPDVLERLRGLVRDVPDFPRPGIVFRDITPLLADGEALRSAVDGLAEPWRGAGVEVVAGIESRGFVLGAAVAYHLGVGLVLLRKRGRLPRRTVSVSYALEYAEEVLEAHADAILAGQRALIVDDVLATGGTASAATSLVEGMGGAVAGLAFLLELAGLGGAAALDGRRRTSLLTL